MPCLKTNQLKYTLDREAFSKVYEVFSVTTAEKYFLQGAQVLDAVEYDGCVLSVLFERGNSFLLMGRTGVLSVKQLRESFKRSKEADSIRIQAVSVSEVPDRKLLQLLLNALGNFETPALSFSNLTGHLYGLCPAWIKRGKKREEQIIWQVPCLEFCITEDFCLEFPVRTFTSVKLRSKITFDKRKFSEYPQYVLTGKNTLRRQLKTDSEATFILRQLDDQKTSIPFMSIKDIDSFNHSKMGLVLRMMETFNQSYTGLANIRFAEIEEYEAVDYTRQCAREDRIRVREVLEARPLHIVDTIGSEDSAHFCKDIKLLLMDKYGIKAELSKRVSKEALNIRVIHHKDYYEGSDDPHAVFANAAVQHITFEDFASHADFALETAIHELIIKQDLIDQHFSLFHWPATGFKEKVAFGLPMEKAGQTAYVFMTVFPDGRFDIEEEQLDMFHFQQYQDCVMVFEDAKIHHENVLGLIRFPDGKINVIKDTGLVSIPEIEKIRNELASGNTRLRGKEAREEYLMSCLDIKSFQKENAAFYLVGTIGEGMRYTLNWAANIRTIEPIGTASLIYRQLLPTMSVTFVRNNQLTVVPFPFKYLREYIKIVI